MIIFSQLESGVFGPTQLSRAIQKSSFAACFSLVHAGTAPVNRLAIAFGSENGSLIWPAELPFALLNPDRAGLSKTILYGTFVIYQQKFA
jgi:hypothetical protein